MPAIPFLAGSCGRCHVVSVLEWGGSKHFRAGTGCTQCHGVSEGHVADERNNIRPEKIPQGAAIAGSAATVWRAARIGTRIETRTHFYDPTRPQAVPWPNPKDPRLYRPVLPAHFRRMTQERGDVRTGATEASPRVEDNQWLLNPARDEPAIAGIVGNLRPGAADFQANLK